MPWTKKNYPKAKKNLSDKSRNKAIQIANAILRIGKLKIAIVLSKAKEAIGDYSTKKINNVKIYTL